MVLISISYKPTNWNNIGAFVYNENKHKLRDSEVVFTSEAYHLTNYSCGNCWWIKKWHIRCRKSAHIFYNLPRPLLEKSWSPFQKQCLNIIPPIIFLPLNLLSNNIKFFAFEFTFQVFNNIKFLLLNLLSKKHQTQTSIVTSNQLMEKYELCDCRGKKWMPISSYYGLL